MPSVAIHPPERVQNSSSKFDPSNPLPGLLQTPSGLAIIEIQGTINLPGLPHVSSDSEDEADESTTEIPVGRIVFPLFQAGVDPDDKAWMKRVYMYVGKHQRVTGEVKALAKPFAVVKKRSGGHVTNHSKPHDDPEDLEIVEIIKYKILFASRPEPVGGEQSVT